MIIQVATQTLNMVYMVKMATQIHVTATTITTIKTVEQRNLGNFITNSGDNENISNSTSTNTNTIDGNWVRNLSKKTLDRGTRMPFGPWA